MPLSKCPRTGKLFDNKKSPVHPSAMAAEESDYEKVTDYVTENPNSPLKDVCEETGVDEACVNRMIRIGRLKEFDAKDLAEQADEKADREAEIARRNLKIAQDLQEAKTSMDGAPAPPADKGHGMVRDMFNDKRRR